MPCRGPDPPQQWEIELRSIKELLRETRGEPFDHEKPSGPEYGRIEDFHARTAELCAWCRSNDVSRYSLELQVWWKHHKKEDARREDAEREQRRLDAVKKEALNKLTPDERMALGVK